MKITKLSLVILAAAVGLVALSPALRAQPTNTPPAGGGRGARGMNADALLTRLETALGTTNKLSEAQLPKVKAVFEKQATFRDRVQTICVARCLERSFLTIRRYAPLPC